jgi:hypothetical protein
MAMVMTDSRRSAVIRSALVTPLCLIVTFFIGALLGDLIFFGLPGHIQDEPKAALAALPALACTIAGGALWGRAIAGIVHMGAARRMMWAGALGYAPTLLLVGITLTVLEKLIVEQRRGPDIPIHVVFTLLFTAAALVVAAVGALALGVALRRSNLMLRLAIGSGLAAGITFLVVDLMLDGVGYRVGAPGAAERATMITVVLTGNVAASLAAGDVIGLLLTGRREV